MISEEFRHHINEYMQNQADKLLARQEGIARASYKVRSGKLLSNLAARPVVGDLEITLPYPMHIRFLDLKKDKQGKQKKNYVPIYNRYVYGYMKSGIWKMLMGAIPQNMVNVMKDTFEINIG